LHIPRGVEVLMLLERFLYSFSISNLNSWLHVYGTLVVFVIRPKERQLKTPKLTPACSNYELPLANTLSSIPAYTDLSSLEWRPLPKDALTQYSDSPPTPPLNDPFFPSRLFGAMKGFMVERPPPPCFFFSVKDRTNRAFCCTFSVVFEP